MKPLPQSFYHRDTKIVAQELLGKLLVRRIDGQTLVGKIVETEAYIGEDDPACHAARGKTKRTAIMYGPPGTAYIYFIYGMYYCLNAVTESEGFPAAVLIRAVEPLEGIEFMQQQRHQSGIANLCNGPGKLCQAFVLTGAQNGLPLNSEELSIADAPPLPSSQIGTSPRIGISKGQDHMWRYFVRNNAFVSHFKRR
jgi:DNA-3-methyladenine glycosylase